MDAPFFQRPGFGRVGKDGYRPELGDDVGPTEAEIYHILMLAYPAYTIDRIEAELSWRQVNELMECWQKHPPTFQTEKRIAAMVESMGGFKKMSYKPLGGDKLEKRLQQMGWLS